MLHDKKVERRKKGYRPPVENSDARHMFKLPERDRELSSPTGVTALYPNLDQMR